MKGMYLQGAGGTPKSFFEKFFCVPGVWTPMSNLFHPGNIKLKIWSLMGHRSAINIFLSGT